MNALPLADQPQILPQKFAVANLMDLFRFGLLQYSLLAPRGYSRERLLALQNKRLRRLLAQAVAHSPFYKRKYRGIDVAHCRLSDLPILTKSEMMQNFDDVPTDRSITRAGIERFIATPANLGSLYLDRFAICHTSGSQGQPALIVQDARAMMTNFSVQFIRGTALKNTWLPHVERLRNPARIAILTQRPGFYPSGATFSYLPAALQPFIKLLRLSVFDPVADNVAKLHAFRPEFLVGYTSSLDILAREEVEGRLKLRDTGCLRQVNNISEPLPDSSRQHIIDAFGVQVFDQYAMGECLALSCGCPSESGSRINIDLGILEVVDAGNNPVPDGQPGKKVLLTNLYSTVQPFIRYEIDDVVTMARGSSGGDDPFPRVQSIQGRSKDTFWIEDGNGVRDLPYYLFLAGLHHDLDLGEHQVLQTGRNRFVLRAAPQPGKVLVEKRLRDLVYQSVASEGLADLVHFDIEIVASIPRGPSGKVSRSQNLFGPPPGPMKPSPVAILDATAHAA